MRQRSKFELFAKFITLLLFVDCVSTENTTDPDVCSMAEGDSAKEIRSANLLKAFTDTYEHRLNLLFIIDRSKSIGEFEANQTKNFIYNLISFLSERRKILINNRYTRIAVVSFGNEATPEFDGISDEENAIDSCIIFDQLNALRTKNDDTHGSDIAAALFRAKEIFDQSKANGDGDDVKQILWIFFDGAEGDPVSYEGHTSQEWAKVLRDGGVKIFSVGVGAWLKVAIKREYQVAELATSNDYYACVDNWMEILNKTRSNPDEIGNQNKTIYTRVADVYKSRCGTCSKGLECVCDAINMKYICAGN
ncbi:hypothetical protein LSH36_738g00059 [Paralvinella palmiformis]|uniref:VWFA domain-containing protein n=1 Tax=Paralvinella palmiformis TaxID=53620 RepID=A0AAD9MUK2_9ANNE|nr:hypothetical protein LSH36_738g00059 [Paralvinella palmiformis]